MKASFIPSFAEEKILWDQQISHVIGIDEVGRGAFAGPVVVAGVIFSPTSVGYYADKLHALHGMFHTIHDSKLLMAHIREKLAPLIKKHCLLYEIAEIPVSTINEVGIGKATIQGMQQVVTNVEKRISPNKPYVLIDGFSLPDVGISQKAIIKGDQKSISIAAASIIAKVYRDAIMMQLSLLYPKYNFAKNKGYGTQDHRAVISSNGLTDIHRTSFDLKKFL